MKIIIFYLASFFVHENLFSQPSSDSLCKLVIKKLKQEGEISRSIKSNECNGLFFIRNFSADSNKTFGFSIIKFGATSPHAKQFFCYLYKKKALFAESYDLGRNLELLGTIFSDSKMSVDNQFIIAEKLIGEIKFDMKQQEYKSSPRSS